MNADASATVAGILISLLAVAAVYVWTALALSAVFRKSGEQAWKAWVPVLTVVVLLQLGGLSPWLVLMALVPVLGGIALWVVTVIACYRINTAFGFGAVQGDGGVTHAGSLMARVHGRQCFPAQCVNEGTPKVSTGAGAGAVGVGD